MSARELAEQWSAGQSAADGAVLHGEFGGWLHRAARGALASGVDGWRDDDIAFVPLAVGLDCRSYTAAGSRRRFRAHKPGCPIRMDTSRWWRGASAKSTSGSRNTSEFAQTG